ncbi:MAG: GxxExxY protein [Flavobacteriales bacterium]
MKAKKSEVLYEKVTTDIFYAALEVHKELGPGLLESVYEYCLIKELRKKGLKVKQQVFIPIVYKGESLKKDFRVDILVNDKIIIELKAVDQLMPLHKAQLLSYLKLANKRVGILINFNVSLLKYGYKRMVNGY